MLSRGLVGMWSLGGRGGLRMAGTGMRSRRLMSANTTAEKEGAMDLGIESVPEEYADSSELDQEREAKKKAEEMEKKHDELYDLLVYEELNYKSFLDVLANFQSRTLRKDLVGFAWDIDRGFVGDHSASLSKWYECEDKLSFPIQPKDKNDPNRVVILDWKEGKISFIQDGEYAGLSRTVIIPSDWLLRFKLFKWPQSIQGVSYSEETRKLCYQVADDIVNEKEEKAFDAVAFSS